MQYFSLKLKFIFCNFYKSKYKEKAKNSKEKFPSTKVVVVAVPYLNFLTRRVSVKSLAVHRERLYLLTKRPVDSVATVPSDYQFDLARASRVCQMVTWRSTVYSIHAVRL